MRSSEDSADHEFVFVAGRRAGAGMRVYGDGAAASRQRRLHPRINQPIPTILDLVATPGPRPWATAPSTTARAKATPLPPELIDLLPPHLRENTVPDFSTSALPSAEDRAPVRPPLPTTYCPGDYYNLEDPATHDYSGLEGPSTHDYLDFMASDALGGLTSSRGHGGRAASVSSTRPSVRNAANFDTASHTAPAALALTDSGISSGGSSCSSSSRSSSSRSLPREGSSTSLCVRPRQPPCPKLGSTAGGPCSARLVSDGERASMFRCLEAVAPVVRAASSHKVGGPQAGVEDGPHVATTVCQSRSSPLPHRAPTPSPTQTPGHSPTLGRKYKGTQSGSSEGEESVAPPAAAARALPTSPAPAATPEVRRAWNVVGVPVRWAGQPGSQPYNIYDNLVLRQPPPAATRSPHPLSCHTPAPGRVARPPVTGKPPSPPTHRRASRSPSPGWTPPYYPAQGGCWVPMWGSSPQLVQAGSSPVYMYSGGPAVLCDARSHSCDRLPSGRPPSPGSGRRSASPWRGGSPSPDLGSGRPPRPRRPPFRKAKTVEVGCLGLVAHQQASPTSPPPSTVAAPAATNRYFMQPVDHHHKVDRHCYSRQQHRAPNVATIPEQCGKRCQECAGAGPSPAATCASSPLPLPQGSPVFAKQEQADGTKQKSGSLEDRVNRLEGDKDSLQLQVTVLSEQIEAQTEKITDLEKLLEQKKEQLQNTEEQLQKEVITRSSLETQGLELFSEISNLKLHQAAYERENIELREKIRRSDHQSDHAKAQPVASGAEIVRTGSGRSIAPAASSTPVHSFIVTPDSPQPSHQLAAQLTNSPSPSSISTLSTIPASSPNKSPAQPTTTSPASSPIASHDGREFLPPRTPPPNARRKIEQFGTVPRQRETGVCGENCHGAPAAGRTKGVMFAETEMQMIDDLPEGEYYQHGDGIITLASSSPRCNTLSGHRSPPTHHKATGIKKIFTRLRRSSSGHLDSDLGEGDFRRGGMRATASARLGWTSPTTTFKEPCETLISWNIETVEAWLGALGLSQYCSAIRSWSSSGHHLSRATPQQLERELGIRHPLHRKKLQLGIAARLSGDQINTPLNRLDHSWVLRWLDDVGLPQYKDAFSEARIDGRVLNCLTYDDLSFLRLTNLLHVTSLKRGIQVLREHNFDPSALKRRSVPDEDQRTRTAAEVALWTNHRVMEWLRTVDLSEYAPNLRGSGVHGALMVYEVRFTSELLASLLSIPCGKTLLRRHLNTHFKELVGRSVVQEKRELETSSGYTPLTTSAKVKMPKKSQFSLKRKKSKSDLEFDDLLCPLDEKPPVGAMQDKKKEVRTGEVEKINSVMVEEVVKKVNTEIMEETNGDGRL